MYAALRSDLTFAEETERASHLRMVAVQRSCKITFGFSDPQSRYSFKSISP